MPFIHRFAGKCLNFTKNNFKGGLIKQKIVSCLGKVKRVTYKCRFPSHNFGMVGFVKELVDELGVDMITSPERGSKVPQQQPKFKRMEIGPGQVFIMKNGVSEFPNSGMIR